MSKLTKLKGIYDNVRHGKSLSIESASALEYLTVPSPAPVPATAPATPPRSAPAPATPPIPPSASASAPATPAPEADNGTSKTQEPKPQNQGLSKQPSEKSKNSDMAKEEAPEKPPSNKPSDTDLMREKFAKLLLGEDMSGGGKGVASALALSNAITNLAASVFGEQKRLEPMDPERRARWRKEVGWLLSVTDYIVEFVSCQQEKDGKMVDVMVWKQRKDLQMNIPALRKLDTMLLDCLENFKGQNEFYYVKHSDEQDNEGTNRKDDKWWLPTVKVPPNGLSHISRKFLQHQKDCVTQVLKAAMAINAQVLLEMAVPESYIESLPKNGRASLGDAAYKGITVEFFDPDTFLNAMDLSSEHKIVDLKNRIEASIVIWKRKMTDKNGRSWGSGVSLEKREVFEERAETVLLLLKHRYPGISQSSLDITKIQYNRDVGQAVLESYSRILESLAYTVLSRIEDVLAADREAAGSQPPSKRHSGEDPSNSEEEFEKSDGAMTLSDFMEWSNEKGGETEKDGGDESAKDDEEVTSYLKSLSRVSSPTPRH